MADVYTGAKHLMLTDQLQWQQPAVVFRAMLVGASYTYNSAHATVADVVAHEVSDASYARVNVTSRTVENVVEADRVLARAANILFPALDNVEVSGCIIYRRTGPDDLTPSDDQVVCFIDFASVTATGVDFILEFIDGVVFVVLTSPLTIEVRENGATLGQFRSIDFRDDGTGSFELTADGDVLRVTVDAAGGAAGEVTWTRLDKRVAAVVTVADNDQAMASAISATPLNGYINVTLNGVEVSVGDGTKVGVDCYFSADGGVTARALDAVVQTDTLHWNGSVAGFQLTTADRISLHYLE